MAVVTFKNGPKHLPVTEAALRAVRFWSIERVNSRGETIPGNGFASAFLKHGGRVFIDTDRYLEILYDKNGLFYKQPQEDRYSRQVSPETEETNRG